MAAPSLALTGATGEISLTGPLQQQLERVLPAPSLLAPSTVPPHAFVRLLDSLATAPCPLYPSLVVDPLGTDASATGRAHPRTRAPILPPDSCISAATGLPLLRPEIDPRALAAAEYAPSFGCDAYLVSYADAEAGDITGVRRYGGVGAPAASVPPPGCVATQLPDGSGPVWLRTLLPEGAVARLPAVPLLPLLGTNTGLAGRGEGEAGPSRADIPSVAAAASSSSFSDMLVEVDGAAGSGAGGGLGAPSVSGGNGVPLVRTSSRMAAAAAAAAAASSSIGIGHENHDYDDADSSSTSIDRLEFPGGERDPAFHFPPLGAISQLLLQQWGDSASSSGADGVSLPRAASPTAPAYDSSLRFAGWGDGDDFSELRSPFPPEFSRLMERTVEASAGAGVCRSTRFRFATPADARVLHTLNRVNDAFVCYQDFTSTIKAKNEFVLVAVRDVWVEAPSRREGGGSAADCFPASSSAAFSSSTTSATLLLGAQEDSDGPTASSALANGAPTASSEGSGLSIPRGGGAGGGGGGGGRELIREEHIVGFINYYLSWFTDRASPPADRPSPAKVAYIATLQAVKPGSHPDVCGAPGGEEVAAAFIAAEAAEAAADGAAIGDAATLQPASAPTGDSIAAELLTALPSYVPAAAATDITSSTPGLTVLAPSAPATTSLPIKVPGEECASVDDGDVLMSGLATAPSATASTPTRLSDSATRDRGVGAEIAQLCCGTFTATPADFR